MKQFFKNPKSTLLQLLQIVNNIGIKYYFSLYQPIKDVKLKMDVNLNVVLVMNLNVCCSLCSEKSYICHLVSMIGNLCVCAAFLNVK